MILCLIACLYQGERLDLGTCEALEVVLKSLRFDFINLRAARLEENGASSLLDMILYYESTAHLDLSDNSHVGAAAWRALAHLIKQVGEPPRFLRLLPWTFNISC
ncbi:hypothetical protein NHX12_020099 [Muraenolepis orangiensis]|uniref:Uncharacterized protein n=1 Tax=Muraenolepis orangiensis TaxID=630683 RepID=A0A9Q0IX74_9TELE|nr:hypothetical protein NHX12_020099 [Muraenolepis orangiensis]